MKQRKRTEKSRYKHESTGDYCTCAAYVAEIMCRRNAENKNVGSLPYKFWNKKPWNWTFKKQLWAAQKILKDFSEEALVKAVNSSDFKGIFSLNHPKCIGVISKYELLLKEENAKPKQEIDIKKDPTVRNKSYGKKNLLHKLRKLENGEEEE
jgi:hypothetical protein|tara:strand:+ start:4953 stop:5408 length:456 start_codon:yes stop_codon:yes gene_type:complete